MAAAAIPAGVYWQRVLNADEPSNLPLEQQAAKQALAEFNPLIGGWRGVGMPKRNSTQGAWIEKAEWVWQFDKQGAGIRYEVTDGKLLESALLTYDPKQKQFHLRARFADDDKTERSYFGTLAGNRLVLESPADETDDVYRITVTQLNEKRTLVLHEKRKKNQEFYVRIAEVGYTRAGTTLAVEGQGEPECIVTGGRGTTPVVFQGQTYYVCCSGCKQAFDDDPAGVVAEYKKKLAEKKNAVK